MAKRKKTRQEKIVADTRHQQFSLEPQYSVNKAIDNQTFTPMEKKETLSSVPYAFVYKDLTKTSIIVSLILILQLVLSFLLKSHLIKLFIINY